MREAARREGRAKLYDGRWRDREPSEAPADAKPTIRLKAPLSGETVIEDQVQGRVVADESRRSRAAALRRHADLHARRRGRRPRYGGDPHHPRRRSSDQRRAAETDLRRARLAGSGDGAIPLIHGPDGSKLSKRHGALGVDAYRALGYLPAALRNYLVRLGWSHGDQEIFSTEEMIAAFDLPQIGRSPARFDFAKLESLNGHYIRASADAALLQAVDQLLPHIAGGEAIAAKMTPRLREQLRRRCRA